MTLKADPHTLRAIKHSKPMRNVSTKQAGKLRVYAKLRTEFLTEHPFCGTGCGNRSVDIHHTEGRGANLNRTETWLAVCRNCHRWIHAYPNTARRQGFLK